MIFAEKVLNFYCIGDSITNGARNEFYRDFVLELNYLFKNKKVIVKIQEIILITH